MKLPDEFRDRLGQFCNLANPRIAVRAILASFNEFFGGIVPNRNSNKPHHRVILRKQ